MSRSLPLICGAGPVGLAAALFLARKGVKVRIIEQSLERSPHSKALAVNPRTLELLEGTGVTGRMLETGRPMVGAQLHRDGRVIAEIDFARLPHKYAFMLALSQATSERLLEEALAECGVRVERGVRLTQCTTNDAVHVTLQDVAASTSEVMDCPWLLAADGAHSTVRHALGLGFPGSVFNREWNLADVPLATSLAADRAHLCFVDEGFLFLLPVVTGTEDDQRQPPVWRVLGNFPNPLDRLVDAEVAGEPAWTSSFRIAHRMVDRMQVGNVYLAGDAAHIHSPAGARGMNLGIEDAWVFSELVRRDQLDRYNHLRRPVVRGVVQRIEAISRVVRGESIGARLIRSRVLPQMVKLGPIRQRIVATMTGLDHGLELDAS